MNMETERQYLFQIFSDQQNLMKLNVEPTCVGDCQPPSQEVEGPVRGVGHVSGKRFEVGLSGQPAHKLSRVRVKLAIVQSVRAVGERVQQGPVSHGELPGGVVARAQGALVTGGGGG